MLRLPRKLAIALASLSAVLSGPSCRRRSASSVGQHVQKLEDRVLLSGSFPMGADNSLAYDAQGYQHIAYYDAAEHDLKYVVQSPAGVWSNPTIIDNTSTDVGKQVALAISPAGAIRARIASDPSRRSALKIRKPSPNQEIK